MARSHTEAGWFLGLDSSTQVNLDSYAENWFTALNDAL